MLNTESRQIGAYTYEVTQMPGRQAFRVFTRLTKMIGPALAELLGKGGGDMKQLLDTNVGTLVPALTVFCDSLSEQEVDALIDTFSEHTKVKGPNISKAAPMSEMFDVVFAGQPGNIIAWLAFSIEVNYRDFLGGLQQSVQGSSGQGTA